MDYKLGYLSARLSVPRGKQFSESVARGKLRFEEKIMSKDKYLSIFSHQMDAIVFILQIILEYFSQIFLFLEKWRISLGYSPVLAGEYS